MHRNLPRSRPRRRSQQSSTSPNRSSSPHRQADSTRQHHGPYPPPRERSDEADKRQRPGGEPNPPERVEPSFRGTHPNRRRQPSGQARNPPWPLLPRVRRSRRCHRHPQPAPSPRRRTDWHSGRHRDDAFADQTHAAAGHRRSAGAVTARRDRRSPDRQHAHLGRPVDRHLGVHRGLRIVGTPSARARRRAVWASLVTLEVSWHLRAGMTSTAGTCLAHRPVTMD